MTDPLRVMIVDDEPLAISRLRRLLVKMPDTEVVGEAEDGETALEIIAQVRPDVLLLDIAMPGLSGLEVGAVLQQSGEPPALVFCTAFDQHALAAFEVAAVDYLLKPVAANRLARALGRARQRPIGPTTRDTSPRLTELWIPHRSEMVRIGLDDVDRIEAERDYVRLHLGDRSFLVHRTMSSLHARLDPLRFIRLHRSTIVRADMVERLRHEGLGVWTAVLRDGVERRVSRGGLAAARALLKR